MKFCFALNFYSYSVDVPAVSCRVAYMLLGQRLRFLDDPARPGNATGDVDAKACCLDKRLLLGSRHGSATVDLY